jgi:hypothetical protein
MSDAPGVNRPERPSDALRRPIPGALYPWVKRASYVELCLFAALIVFWLAPGFETETMVFGWAHGLGFIGLALLIWMAVLRHEAPYTLLAATLTPVGPVGSVIAIEWMERHPRQPSAEVRGGEQVGNREPEGRKPSRSRIANRRG